MIVILSYIWLNPLSNSLGTGVFEVYPSKLEELGYTPSHQKYICYDTFGGAYCHTNKFSTT